MPNRSVQPTSESSNTRAYSSRKILYTTTTPPLFETYNSMSKLTSGDDPSVSDIENRICAEGNHTSTGSAAAM
jgi:hypothetical protein